MGKSHREYKGSEIKAILEHSVYTFCGLCDLYSSVVALAVYLVSSLYLFLRGSQLSLDPRLGRTGRQKTPEIEASDQGLI